MVDYKLKYDQLKKEFESYQFNAEYKIQSLSSLNMYLEKNINVLSNIVEISNYVNSFLSSDNLMATINDMIIGILGVTHSTVYILEEQDFIIKATSLKSQIEYQDKQCETLIKHRREFILNSEEALVVCDEGNTKIQSLMGIPINVRDKFIGYIIVMQTHFNFFNDDHRVFLTAIASQAAIAIENSILYNRIQKAAKMDPLIGIYNRKTFFDIVHRDVNANPDSNYAIVMIDFDNFKNLNDTLGHQFGDEALIQTSNLIMSYLDEEDIFSRYGGEELIIYLPNQKSYEYVYYKIDEIRRAISKNLVKHDGIEKSITGSFGISIRLNNKETLDEIIKVADRRLYIAKATGKNKVVYED